MITQEFRITYGTIVPDDLQNELMSIGQMSKDGMFRIGEITNYLLENIRRYDGGVSKEQIYSAVGAFCGKAARTVRDYAAIEHFYPPEIKMEYDVLFFDHFRFAARFPDSWREILDYAVNRVNELGRPATVDDLVAKFTFGQETEQSHEELEDLNPTFTKLSNVKKAVTRARDMLYEVPEFENRHQVQNLLERVINLMKEY